MPITHVFFAVVLLQSANLVIITFEFQKNNWRNHSVHLFASTDHLLCPVKAAAFSINRVLKILGATLESKTCTVCLPDGNITYINSAQALPKLRAIVAIIGEDALGFSPNDIGLHSLRSGGAMAMFLSGTPTIIIMRIGRWSSEAFLEYIREQIEQFTWGVSQKMLTFENFHTTSSSVQPTVALDPIFVEDNKGNGTPISITHAIEYTDLSLGNVKPANHINAELSLSNLTIAEHNENIGGMADGGPSPCGSVEGGSN